MKSIEVFRNRLDLGEKLVGGSVTMKDPMSADIITQHMDFAWIDMEHGGLDISSVERHIIASKKNRKPALVRIPELTAGWVKQVLDSGAHGIIVPQLYTPEEVKQAVAFSRYYPSGARGFGPRVPNTYGAFESAAEYIEWANTNIFICVQIETAQAYEQLDAILSIAGYDSIVIGPADLSLNCGYYADITHPHVIEMIGSIIERAHSYNKYVGFGMAIDPPFAKRILQLGVDWLQVGGDFDYVSQSALNIFRLLNQDEPN